MILRGLQQKLSGRRSRTASERPTGTMKHSKLRHAKTGRNDRGTLGNSDRRVRMSQSLRTVRFYGLRTTLADDKILETSDAFAMRLDNAISQRAAAGDVQDILAAHSAPEEETVRPDDRPRLILSLLIRPEAMQIAEAVLSSETATTQRERLGTLLLSSPETLHVFGRLVTEGALTTSGGLLQLTE